MRHFSSFIVKNNSKQSKPIQTALFPVAHSIHEKKNTTTVPQTFIGKRKTMKILSFFKEVRAAIAPQIAPLLFSLFIFLSSVPLLYCLQVIERGDARTIDEENKWWPQQAWRGRNGAKTEQKDIKTGNMAVKSWAKKCRRPIETGILRGEINVRWMLPVLGSLWELLRVCVCECVLFCCGECFCGTFFCCSSNESNDLAACDGETVGICCFSENFVAKKIMMRHLKASRDQLGKSG